MRDVILILTGENDLQADAMVAELGRRGQPVVRLHPESLAAQSSLALHHDGARSLALLNSYGCPIDATRIRSAWYRKPRPARMPQAMAPEERDFARHELDHLLRAFLAQTDCFWVSPPDAMRYASLKPAQLAAARSFGLKIPRTLFTNDPEEAAQFIAAAKGEVIFKTLQSPVVAPDAVCFTSTVTAGSLQSLELIRRSGGIFQDRVEKFCDLRIIVIGNTVHAFAIHSQENDESRIDWRKSVPADTTHTVHRLPTEIERRIKAFVRGFGLEFSAIDLVLTPEGEYVFLENNPGGQFGWLEALTGIPLNSAIADLLVRGGTNRRATIRSHGV